MPICQCGEVFKLRRTGPALTSCKACRRAKAREQSRLRMAAMRSRKTTGKKHGVVTNLVHEMDSRIEDAGSPKLLEPEAPKPDESQGSQDTLSALSIPPDSVRTMDTAKAGVKTIQVSASAVEAMPDWMKAKILEFQKTNL